MSYSQQLLLARALTIVVGAITLIQGGNADVLGLSARVLAWLVILSGVIALALGFLPSVRGMSRDPEFLLHRIRDLPADERLVLASALADMAAADPKTPAESDPLPPNPRYDRG